MKNEKDLYMKFVVLKIEDINSFMSETERNLFWKLFWDMVDRKEGIVKNEMGR